MKKLSLIMWILLLAACGGSTSSTAPTVITVPPFATPPTAVVVPPPPPVDLLSTPNGTSCGVDPDVFGVAFETVNTVQSQSHGCLIVNSTDKQPVFDGLRSARFEVRQEDCGASVSFNDCTNDRSRHEISEKEGSSTSGQLLTWEENIYIPTQTRFRPKGKNALFITQINFKNKADYGTIAYLEIGENGELLVRTHNEFTFDIKTLHVIANSFPVDTWTNIKFEVLSTPQSNGYIRVYLNGKLVVEENRPTLPTAEYSNMMRVGIYNAFKSRASETYATQVIYFDGVKKNVRYN
jgi:hypothetical protein